MQLSSIYQNSAVKELGEALGNAIGKEQDYASLTDLEVAQTRSDFADAIHRFLRRFHTMASKKENLWNCPPSRTIEELMKLVDDIADSDDEAKYREAIRLVRAALLSYALTQATYYKIQKVKEDQGGAVRST